MENQLQRALVAVSQRDAKVAYLNQALQTSETDVHRANQSFECTLREKDSVLVKMQQHMDSMQLAATQRARRERSERRGRDERPMSAIRTRSPTRPPNSNVALPASLSLVGCSTPHKRRGSAAATVTDGHDDEVSTQAAVISSRYNDVIKHIHVHNDMSDSPMSSPHKDVDMRALPSDLEAAKVALTKMMA